MREIYPIIYIDIDDLRYMPEHPKFYPGQDANAAFLDMHKTFENQLRLFGKTTGNKYANKINKIWNSIQEESVKNPLIVKFYKGFFYVIIGCQRLTCLKAMNYRGKVGVRLTDDDDPFDKNCKAFLKHPYE